MPGISYYWQHHPQVEPCSAGDIIMATTIIVAVVVSAVIAVYFIER